MNRRILCFILVNILVATPLTITTARGQTPEIGTVIVYSFQASTHSNWSGETTIRDYYSVNWINVTETLPSGTRLRVEGDLWQPRWTPVVNNLSDLDSFHLNQFPFFFIKTDWDYWNNEISNNGILEDSFVSDSSVNSFQTDKTIFHSGENTTHYNIFFQKNEWRNSTTTDNGNTIFRKYNSTRVELLVFEKEFGALVLRDYVSNRDEISQDEPFEYFYSRTTHQMVAVNITSPQTYQRLSINSTILEIDLKILMILAFTGTASIFYIAYLRQKRNKRSHKIEEDFVELYPVKK